MSTHPTLCFDGFNTLLIVNFSGREPTLPPCTLEEFKCSNGHCVPLPYVCDHNDNCGDLTDELGCSKLQNGKTVINEHMTVFWFFFSFWLSWFSNTILDK